MERWKKISNNTVTFVECFTVLKSTSHVQLAQLLKLAQLILTNKLVRSGIIILSFTSRKMKAQPILVAGSAYKACN